MRKIEFTEIQSGAAMPYKAGTFEHLLQSVREISIKLTAAQMPNMDTSPGNINVIQGIESVSPGTYTAGAIIYDGAGIIAQVYPTGTQNFDSPGFFKLDDTSFTGPEIFIVKPSVGVSPTTPVWLVKGSFVGNSSNADPVLFSNSTFHDVHSTWFVEIAVIPSGTAYKIGTFADLYYAYSSAFTNTWLTNVVQGPSLMHTQTMLTTKVINIGDWDMQTNSNKTVAHGVPDFTTIRSISVVIRNDNNTYHYDLTRAGIIARWTTTNIDLLRDLGGTFDNVDFNATSYNRGFVTITYEG